METPTSPRATDRPGNQLPSSPTVQDIDRQADQLRIIDDADLSTEVADRIPLEDLERQRGKRSAGDSARPNRSTIEEDISNQLDTEQATLFWRHDLPAALTLLSRNGVWESLPSHGGGRRLTVEGLTVGAFHLYATEDELDPRPNALAVYAVDVWPDGFPDDPNQAK